MGPWCCRRDHGEGGEDERCSPQLPRERSRAPPHPHRESGRLDARVAVLVVSPARPRCARLREGCASPACNPRSTGSDTRRWLLQATKAIGRAPASSIAGSTTSFQVAASAATVGLSRELRREPRPRSSRTRPRTRAGHSGPPPGAGLSSPTVSQSDPGPVQCEHEGGPSQSPTCSWQVWGLSARPGRRRPCRQPVTGSASRTTSSRRRRGPRHLVRSRGSRSRSLRVAAARGAGVLVEREVVQVCVDRLRACDGSGCRRRPPSGRSAPGRRRGRPGCRAEALLPESKRAAESFCDRQILLPALGGGRRDRPRHASGEPTDGATKSTIVRNATPATSACRTQASTDARALSRLAIASHARRSSAGAATRRRPGA